MQMNPDEIITCYRQAKDPNAQRGILADLNCCTVHVIDAILHNAGVRTEPLRTNRKRPGKVNDAIAFARYRAGYNDREIAMSCDVSTSTARRWRVNHNLPANRLQVGGRAEL